MVANFDRRLKWALRADAILSGVISIVIPLGIYVAMPAYAKMYKVPDPAAFIFNARIAALAFGLFFLFKTALNIKAISLSTKWVIASVLFSLPAALCAIYLLLAMEWSLESLYAVVVAIPTLFGTSLAVAIFGVQKVLKSEN